jgi:hypothetical protein
VTTDDAAAIQYLCGDAKGKFRVVPRGNGTYQIVVDYDGKCLHVYNASTTDYTAVTQFTCSATAPNNLWRFVPVEGRTTFRIVSVQSGKCLNVRGNSLALKATVIIFPCGGLAAQNDQFLFPPAVAASLAAPLPVVPNTPVHGVQGGTNAVYGPLVYGFVNNEGQLVRGYQNDPDNFDSVTWTMTSGPFAGHPEVDVQTDGRVQLAARHADDGDLWLGTQNAKGNGAFGTWQDVGGSAAGQPVTGRQPNGALIAFEIVDGGLWHLPQDGTNAPYAGWRYIGGTNLVGDPVVVVAAEGLRIFAMDSSGTVQVALYAGGRLGDWASLGGSGLVGPPAVLVRPGYLNRVVMRTSEGTLVTKLQHLDYKYDAEWIALPPVDAAGPPAIMLDSRTGREVLVVRTADNTISYLTETGQSMNAWTTWRQASPTVVATDPTIMSYRRTPVENEIQTWGYLVRDAELQPYVVTAEGVRRGENFPTLTEHRLPTPPAN